LIDYKSASRYTEFTSISAPLSWKLKQAVLPFISTRLTCAFPEKAHQWTMRQSRLVGKRC